MDQNIIKHKRLELFLNKIEFKDIKVGSLLANALVSNYYNTHKLSLFNDLMVLIKYILTLPLSKHPWQENSTFIFTKLTNRIHFNELMDPLILHFLDRSIIVCGKQAFDPKLSAIHQIYNHSITARQTISNTRGDIGRILLTTFKVLIVLSSNKVRLKISFNEIIYLVTDSLIQLRVVSFWDRYFKKSAFKPKCIVSDCDRMALSSPLILTARKHNILTITLTHGVICEYGFIPILADYRFCWGRSQKNQLIAMGIAPHRISITGNPMIKTFDQHSEKYLQSPNGITVCLAISPEADSINKSLIENFIYAIEQLENVKGIIKLHPSLKKGKYEWVNSISSKIVIFESSEITNNELFKIIDLIIVHYSGIANEALAAGTPVMVMEPTGLSYLNVLQADLNQKAGCKIATNSEELIEILNKLIANPNLFRIESIKESKEYLENLFEFIGDESVQAMISEIDRLSGEVIPNTN